MAKQTANSAGRYLYAVIAGTDERMYGPVGIDGGAVYTLSDGRVAAVVSDVPNVRIRPERRNIAAHQEVLSRLMTETTPLPMSFGIIADGAKAVLRILSRNRKAFLQQLGYVADKVEMGLRVTWEVPNIIEYFVLTHAELRAARDRFLGGRREPSQEDRIELGRTFDRILTEDRETHAEKVEEVLAGCCAAIKRNRPRNEREAVNLACLVSRGDSAEFEGAVFNAAKLFDNSFAFDYNGPWAPHNFVDIDLKEQ
ncbi:MAG: GvpL/GvpF family gas vesicle protein [Syntrophobacteraceae bacterium]